ncbi:GCN5-related N-acetyltransferase [Desulfofarcimen acetoxidans DSM 771]|jgi:N-acetylglutamate synthase-like GNAT family acetyltransferase|uniref:GCN5-related N-acetyltransferase n=1 Tax=Desulfofarcimen acetoxidans (strain ATCC 49208 / DSM 771 / KCTC 5769 / VKM B-1644 / 5575) TaxID=485916 RepID=C8VZZ6_DESAS|nr:GNAT family N-acetyltransferase [Desulfofarcimen acetoxidans]ACV64964.1 GCN5-related N-acetyltransferase [Desulfofarcimen acetoxidans DSM 771]
MIRPCINKDLDTIHEIINDASRAYKTVIPEDRFKEPYMTKEELQHEIDDGVIFWGYEENGKLIGVMGIQRVKDVTLIRHAYVQTINRRKGIGKKLLSFLVDQTTTNRPILIGTWAEAKWAISFYEKHGFRLVSPETKNKLLRTYWSIPERQIETSVVLANQTWFETTGVKQ